MQPAQNVVSWQSAFWALMPLALNSMTQPGGMVCFFPQNTEPHYEVHQSYAASTPSLSSKNGYFSSYLPDLLSKPPSCGQSFASRISMRDVKSRAASATYKKTPSFESQSSLLEHCLRSSNCMLCKDCCGRNLLARRTSPHSSPSNCSPSWPVLMLQLANHAHLGDLLTTSTPLVT